MSGFILSDDCRYPCSSRVLKVCRRFQAIIDLTPSLQLIIEFAAAGYCATGVQSRDLAQNLASFRAAQRMYRNPNIRLVDTVDLRDDAEMNKHEWSGIWHKFGDIVLGYTKHSQEALGVLALDPAVLTRHDGTTTASQRFHIVPLPCSFARVFVDPSQDLLTVHTSTCIHFLSLLTGKAHEKAKGLRGEYATLTFPKYPGWSVECSVYADWILQSFGPDDLEIDNGCDVHLYHWPTGQVKMVRNLFVS